MTIKGTNIYKLASAFASTKIDREAGIIFGVSVITEGDALGHGFEIDAQTLTGVMGCAVAFADGVRVKIEHGTGFESIVGTLKNFRVDGKQLRADMHLILSHESTPAIMEMAEKMPGGFGLSIAFSGKHEMSDGAKLARCTELYSVDLVDRPAANPGGLFSAKFDFPNIGMADTAELKMGLIEALKTFFTKDNEANPLVALTAKLSATQSELDAAQAEIVELKKPSAELAALTKERDELKATIANPEGEIAKLASAKALEIVAAQGGKVIPLKAETNPSGKAEATTWTERCAQAKSNTK